jgi:hypothetical protein
LDVNTTGSWLCAQAAAKYATSQDHAHSHYNTFYTDR